MIVLKRVLGYTKRYWQRLVLSVIAATLYGLFSAAPTWLIKYIIDDVFVEKHVHLLTPFIIGLISMFFIKGLFMYLSNYYMNWVGSKVVNDIREDLFSKIIHFPISFYQKTTSGQLLAYFLNDIGIIQSVSSTAIRNGVRSFFEAIFLISVACKQNIYLALLLVVLGPLIAMTIQKMGVYMRSTANKTQHEMGNISSLLQELFIGIREIKSFNSETTEVGRFRRYLGKYFSSVMRNVRVVSLTPAFIEIIAMSGCGVIFYISSMQVLNGSITPGQLTSFFAATILAYQPLKRLINVYADIQTGTAAASRVFKIMDLTYPANQNRTTELESFNKSIELKNFSFNYDENSKVLENVNLRIRKGENIGLIGPSGSGKSTLCDLLLGFIQGQKGTLFIDGKDITEISFSSLRKHIGYVGQRTFLFNDTIKANIAYAQPDVTEEEIIKASRSAFAHEFITRLPEGYDTVVGEDGTLLSGGQKQRITIARALLKNPEIIIFDEATSALDQKSEAEIRLALDEICKSKTVIIISHRLSFIDKMDRVLIIQNKQIVEMQKDRLSKSLLNEGEKC